MKYLDFKEKLHVFLVFSLSDIRNFFPDFDRRRLNEWQDKNYIEMIIRGYYRFTDTDISEPVLYLIANRIYSPSYISLETGLSYYHIIPESVYTITSVGSEKTTSFSTPIATFSYQSVRPDLMFGTKLVNYQNQYFKIGELEKVILDYLYLHHELNTEQKIFELRFNKDELTKQIDWHKMDAYLSVFQNQALKNRIELVKKEVLSA